MADNELLGVCGICSRVFLILFNIVIGVMGIVLLAGGVLLKVAVDILQGFSNNANTLTTYNIPLGGSLLDPLNAAAIALIVIGALLFLLSIIGCLTGCVANKCLLITYAILAGLICIALIVGTCLMFAGPLLNKTKGDLENVLNKEYAGSLSIIESKLPTISVVDPKNATIGSLLIDAIQKQYQCCGLNSTLDFAAATNWPNKIMVTGTTGVVTLTIPASCCMGYDLTTPDAAKVAACLANPDDTNSYQSTGCWKKLEDQFNVLKTPGIIVMSVLICIMFLLALMAVCLCCIVNNEKRSPKQWQDNNKRDNRYNNPYVPEYYAKENPYVRRPQQSGNDGGYYNRGYDDDRYDSYGGRGGPRTVNSRMYTPDWYSPDRRQAPRVMSGGTFSNSNVSYGQGYR